MHSGGVEGCVHNEEHMQRTEGASASTPLISYFYFVILTTSSEYHHFDSAISRKGIDREEERSPW